MSQAGVAEPSIMDTLALLQRVALDMAKAVAAICDKHELSYSLIFGSLIGAVRHKGFIPWDDDLDVAMPRPDYEKFLEVAPLELPSYYEIHNYKMGNTLRCVTRIVDTRILLKLNSYEDGNILPAWVDIFAIDGLPDKQPAKAIHYMRIQWRKAMWAFAGFESTVNKNRPGRPRWQQLIIDFCAKTHFGSHLDVYDQLDKYDKALKRYPFDYSTLCCCGMGTYSPQRQTWKRSAFEELVQYDFEGTLLMGAGDYDSVLSATYGDYMTLPPEDQRIVHELAVYKNDLDESDDSE